MTTANHLINALAAQDKDEANAAFDAVVQEKVGDFLEVRKVELASTIMDGLEEGYNDNVPDLAGKKVAHDVEYEKKGKTYKGVVHAARSDGHTKAHGAAAVKFGIKTSDITSMSLKEATSAERQYVRQVASVGRAYTKPDGSSAKRSIHQGELKAHAKKNLKKLGPETVQYHADVLKQTRQSLKAQGKLPGLRTPKLDKEIKRVNNAFGEEAIVEGSPTRKHFQQTADLLKNIPDEAKRKELAQHHAGLYKAQNPRFDRAKFMSASGVSEALEAGSAAPSNAKLNANVMANIRRAVQTLGVKGVNPTMAAAGHRDFGKLVAKNPKAPGYALLRKLAPGKAAAVQGLTQAGVPLGASLEASPQEFNQVVQRIKRFK